jgi:hypothetical protein
VIFALADDGGRYGPYIQGRLTLANFDYDGPAWEWFDAVYALLADAPHEVLGKLADSLTATAARSAPRDRSTWGLTPEQIALTQRQLGQI